MKRKTLALTLVLALLFSAVVGAQFNKAKAEKLIAAINVHVPILARDCPSDIFLYFHSTKGS